MFCYAILFGAGNYRNNVVSKKVVLLDVLCYLIKVSLEAAYASKFSRENFLEDIKCFWNRNLFCKVSWKIVFNIFSGIVGLYRAK